MFGTSFVHCGVDPYPGSECAGGGGGDQHYGPLGMFSVCKSMVFNGLTAILGPSVQKFDLGPQHCSVVDPDLDPHMCPMIGRPDQDED
jgi:hypothetical protein